jgi:hypothetical protein
MQLATKLRFARYKREARAEYQGPRADGGKCPGERLFEEARCPLLQHYTQLACVQLARVQLV